MSHTLSGAPDGAGSRAGTEIRMVVHQTTAALARAVAERIVTLTQAAVAARGRVRLALAGGSTPRSTYAALAESPYREAIQWARLELFWGDERCVPPEHPDSNYRMAHEALLSRVPIPLENIHRMRGELPDPEAAARDYEARMRSVFGPEGEGPPRFDLILLGLGPDGHTASLFPGSAAIREARRWVMAPWVATLGMRRLTLTPPVLNGARHVLFLVAGMGKAKTLRDVLEGPVDADRLPAQIVKPDNGSLEWFLDRQAASHLVQPR